ncbi:MAG: sulfurtransferase [Undibacterium sp.]|nr:sulfurtransferase [Undibacterium sp.]
MMYTTLISAQDLAGQIVQPEMVLIDCRHDLMDSTAGELAYNAGHLPGARFAHLDQQLSGVKISVTGLFCGRHPLPAKEDFIRHLRALGIKATSQVIAYDAQGGMYAARLWWMLRWVGHSAVAVLDGGVPAWLALGLPLDTTAPQIALGDIGIKPSLVAQVNIDEVIENLSTAARTVVDARAADRYRGENETIDPVGGHIPGAVNRFFKDNLQADGCFKSAEHLHEEWLAVCSDASKAIMQCGSGVTACHNLLALEVAGLTGAALYPGSWSEWCADPARPVATGC